MTLPIYKTLQSINTNQILQEIKFILDPSLHVWLQQRVNCLYDLPYTNKLLKKYKMYNTRIMCLSGKQCYTWHIDQTPRIHIPLITNEKCKFIIEDTCFNLPIDNIYWVDTTKYHTALNGNKEFDRYHIVGLTDELV